MTYRRVQSGKPRAALAAGGESLYGTPPVRPANTIVKGFDERSAMRTGFGFLMGIGILGSGMLAGIIALVVLGARVSGWTTQAKRAPPVVTRSQRDGLQDLRRLDPDFSIVAFEDFVYALYAEAHTARGSGRLETLSPYLAANARQHLAALGAVPVSTVVVGAMTYSAVRVSSNAGAAVTLELEANYTEGAQSYWTLERWQLARGPHARSRPPDRVRVFACPSCGAPLDKIIGGTCQYCHQVVDSGAFDWIVTQIAVEHRESRPPLLTGTTEEQGTDLPTRVDAGLPQAVAALKQRDETFDEQNLLARVGLVFSTMQHAWSTLKWEEARAFLSDNLWTSQTYWIDAYRRSGLRNINENARILGLELVRVTSDRWYDAATLRVHATGLDYTLRDSDQSVVGGSRSKERRYSEYWTLIRSSAAKGKARTEPVCPNCGGPLAINAAGHCDHCQVKVTSGQFDWVLSRIEQDETYLG
ncbi:MAG: TIM44-like domain-containing protein [Polyangiaceae bacterium]